LSRALAPFPGVATAGRLPRFSSSVFSVPTIEFCGSAAGCAGVSQSAHMRTSSSFADYAGSDLTLFVNVARANGNRNYLLVNQSSGNNTGIFLGWISSTTMRFGLNGPSGTPNFDVTVPTYAGPPALELWTVRLNSGSSAEMP